MTELQKLTEKTLPIVRVLLDCYNKNRQLVPIGDAIHDIQIAVQWLGLAIRSLPQYTSDDLVEGNKIDTPMPKIMTPTLIGTHEQLAYAKEELAKLSKSLDELAHTTPMIDPVTCKQVNNGSDKLMEAVFNINLATTHYEPARNLYT